MNIEKTILKNLIKSESYTRKVLPFLKEEYFIGEDDRVLFKEIKAFILKYNNLPTPDALVIEVDSLRGLNETQVKNITKNLQEIAQDKTETNLDWLSDNTEKFCQEKSIYNAIMKSIDIMNNKNGTMTKGAIPQLLSDALAISFDPKVGHDYLEQYDYRYEYYHRVLEKIPFDLEFFNKITNEGLPKKTLNIVLAGTGTGKSLFMCHMAASCLNMGKNVLYITLELAEEEVAKRIDANLMNITFDDLMALPKDIYTKKAENLKGKTNGRLIVKEYPTAGASTIHFKALLNELNLKKSFRPDIIFVDYLNICMSARVKPGSNINSYTYVKAIAEELRGLAVEYEVPLVSATQTTRSGFSNSDLELTDTSECIFVDEKIRLVDGTEKNIGDSEVGDQITANDDYKTIMQVHHKKMKECVKITTKSGKTIIVSRDHIFPTNNGRISVNMGLKIGDKLHSKL
jgi:replicative DNA helicase